MAAKPLNLDPNASYYNNGKPGNNTLVQLPSGSANPQGGFADQNQYNNYVNPPAAASTPQSTIADKLLKQSNDWQANMPNLINNQMRSLRW